METGLKAQASSYIVQVQQSKKHNLPIDPDDSNTKRNNEAWL